MSEQNNVVLSNLEVFTQLTHSFFKNSCFANTYLLIIVVADKQCFDLMICKCSNFLHALLHSLGQQLLYYFLMFRLVGFSFLLQDRFKNEFTLTKYFNRH